MDHLLKKIKEREYSGWCWTCFQNDLTFGDFRYLPIKTVSHKVLCDKAFDVTKNPKHDGYKRGLVSLVYKFPIKRFPIVVLKMKLRQTKNQQKRYTKQLLENLKNENYTHLLKTIFEILILQICNW